MTEQLANLAHSLLSSPIDTDDTTLTVDDGSVFPATGDYRLVVTDGIDTELMLATARTGNAITVTRAQEGTSAQSFSAAATVALVLTADSLADLIAVHPADTVDAHPASAIGFTPTGSLVATDVQAAIVEAASEGGGGREIIDSGRVSQGTYDGDDASASFGGASLNGGTA